MSVKLRKQRVAAMPLTTFASEVSRVRTLTGILSVVLVSIFVGCASKEPPLPSELQATARASQSMRIEEEIAEIVRTNRDFEMGEFRTCRHGDVDGDGLEDTILLTTFEHGNMWRRELFVCLGASPRQVVHVSLGAKGERMAEDFQIGDGTIVVRGKTYTDGDALCCPSKPYQSTFVIAGGTIVERGR